jgi:hypothetical protein
MLRNSEMGFTTLLKTDFFCRRAKQLLSVKSGVRSRIQCITSGARMTVIYEVSHEKGTNCC